MGEVYRAEDTKLGREMAIKVLLAEMADDPERLERFQREARTEHDTLFAWTRAFCEQQDIIATERIRKTVERIGLP